MGYDDGECISCFCTGGGNNLLSDDSSDNDRHTPSCLTCIDEMCKSGATYRVLNVLKENDWNTNGTCGCCFNTDIITIDVTICSFCKSNLQKDDSSDVNLPISTTLTI
jgi:hypothetical protein